MIEDIFHLPRAVAEEASLKTVCELAAIAAIIALVALVCVGAGA